MCTVTLHNIQYNNSGDMIQFDYFISPADTCSVNNVYIQFGVDYVMYSSRGLDSDCGMRSDGCLGITQISFCQEEPSAPSSVPTFAPSGAGMFNENDTPTIVVSTSAPSDFDTIVPTGSSLAPSSCYANNCGASNSDRSIGFSRPIPECSSGLTINESLLPLYDTVSLFLCFFIFNFSHQH